MRRQLHKIFNPRSIAAIGASDREGTVGYALIRNLRGGTYNGKVYPVNPGHWTIHRSKSYPTVGDIGEKVDLAIIATPAKVVGEVIEQCGEAGVGGIVIISAGFKEVGEAGKKRYAEIKKIARKYNLRILGPNCLGFINPSIGLNASFARGTALPGKIAFVSQSGALCTAILDWANDQSVGFSNFVSLGSMVDIGFHDLIDYFGTDPNTSSILIYMESLKNPRRFMSAARAFARHKPIIILKAGKSIEGARASLSHTGSLAGNDAAFSAAFRRAGVLQVDTIAQLFHCAQALAMQPLPKGNRLAIVTNAGGPGVLATDYLISNGGKLASLSDDTMGELNDLLPAHWSHNNPVDVLGDANAEIYCSAVRSCVNNKNVDAVLAILTTQAVTDPADVARALVAEKFTKPILACWMGESDVAEGREILEQGSIPNYRYPESVVQVFLKMCEYNRNLELIYETPPNIPERLNPDQQGARKLFDQVLKSGRRQLTETEAKSLMQCYEIPVPEGKVVTSEAEAVAFAKEIGFPVVMKIVSPEVGHKSDVGGVVVRIGRTKEARTAYNSILKNVGKHLPNARINGVRVEKMVRKRYELLIGARKDPIFGPVIVFGSGGILVELYRDTCLGLPPLNMALALRTIEGTRVYELLQGYRNLPAVDLEALQFLLVKFSYLVMDFPEIKEIDINPFAVDENGGLALDAHVVLDPVSSDERRPYDHLVITPYPVHYQRDTVLKDGQAVHMRAIKPEDEPQEAEMLTKVSKESLYFRFMGYMPKASHNWLSQFTQIDYDREMAIVAEVEEAGKKQLAGVVRIISDPWKEMAEYAILVADPWQGLGLGSALTDFILDIARERGIGKITAEVLQTNGAMRRLLQRRDFKIVGNDAGVQFLEKVLAEVSTQNTIEP